MLFSLFVGVVAFTLLYVWLVMHRQRAMAMEDALDDAGWPRHRAAAIGRCRRRRARTRHRRRRTFVMEDAGFIIGSYVITFARRRRLRL